MKLHLANTVETPPGGWRYTIEALAEKAPGISKVGPFNALPTLMMEIQKRCAANGVSAPTQEEVEDQMCQHMEPGRCRDEENYPTQGVISDLVAAAGAVMQGTATMGSWWLNGQRRVAPAEITRRTMICAGCAERVPVGACSACSMRKMRDTVNAIVANTKLASDVHIKDRACRICLCSLEGKVRMEKSDILPHMTKKQMTALHERAPHCWLIEEETHA